VAFLLKEDRIIAPILIHFKHNEEKHQAYFTVGTAAKDLCADKVFLINEVAARLVTNKEDAEYMAKNYDHENPLSYPESMRLDGILFIEIDLKSEKSDALFHRYTKDGEKFVFEEKIKTFQELAGTDESVVFTGVLVDCVLDGFRRTV